VDLQGATRHDYYSPQTTSHLTHKFGDNTAVHGTAMRLIDPLVLYVQQKSCQHLKSFNISNLQHLTFYC
jgi:hypothetical protein